MEDAGEGATKLGIEVNIDATVICMESRGG